MATNGAELTNARYRNKAAQQAAANRVAGAPTAYTQTYSTADRTIAAPTAVTTGLSAVAVTGAATSSYGFTEAQANALIAQVNFLIVAVTALIADDLDVRRGLTGIIDDLQASGVVS